MLNENELSKGFFMKKNLSKKDIEQLKSLGYEECSRKSILSEKREEYLIRKVFDQSSSRIILINELAEFLENHTKMARIIEVNMDKEKYQPDIVFMAGRRRFAISIQSKKPWCKANKNIIRKKIKFLKENYRNNWFFVLSNRKFTPKYKKLGKTYDKRNVINKIWDVLLRL
jgi:hypothetical protein